ncbi:MAG: hypothetical protein JMN27_07965 [gamma proteobacterium endosymbiont of Lamellibrachia anaximandri]|nr:hypothetical protein [gamma proteobacterium endosymbiont of Lamellibrachia anaximandri]MBL3533751.1 hypothetical protein [gamma proteobacterium endosymbiont of Lamellibrachia anaximandri]
MPDHWEMDMGSVKKRFHPHLQSLARICIVLCLSLGYLTPTYSETAIQDGAIPIDQLRAAQQKELDALREGYRNQANKPGADQDALFDRYRSDRNRLQEKYNRLDTRNKRVDEMIKQTGAAQTGSNTKDVRADVDTAGNTDQIDRKMVEELKRRGHDVDTSNPSKVVDHTDDHVYWRKETAAGNKAKETDFDSFKTPGGRDATGNLGEVRDARGEGIDHSSKYHHGRADGDLKTMGKSVSKMDKASDRVRYDETKGAFVKDQGEFRRSLAEHPDPEMRALAKIDPKTGKSQADTLVDQAKAFQKYGDPVTAGIADLGDSPEVQAQKVKEWQKRSNKYMDAAEQRANRRGDVRDKVTENVEQSYRNANSADPAEKEWNRNAADDIDNNRRRVREGNEVGDRFLSGEKRRKTADETYSGGWKDRGEPVKGAIPDDELQRRLNAAEQSANAKKQGGIDSPDGGAPKRGISSDGDLPASGIGARRGQGIPDPDLPSAGRRPSWADGPTDVVVVGKRGKAKVTAIDGRLPKSKPNIKGAVGAGVEAGLQMGEATARKLGEVLDRSDQTVTGKDMADIVKEGSGYEPMRKAVEDTRMRQRIKKIELENKIRDLEKKPGSLTAAEQSELGRLKQQAANTDTTTSNLQDLGQQMLVDPNKEIIGRRMGEMEAQAKAEGRKSEFLRDGLPAMGKAGAEVVGNAVGIGAAANMAAEMETFNERSDWSAQKNAMVQHLNDKARWADKRNRKATAELEGILFSGNADSPENQQRVEQLLGEIAANQAEMDKIVAIANGNLSEVDPKKLATIRGLAGSQPDPDAMRDYARQMSEGARQKAEEEESWLDKEKKRKQARRAEEEKRRKVEEEKARLAEQNKQKETEADDGWGSAESGYGDEAPKTAASGEEALTDKITEIMLTEPDPERRKELIRQAIRKHAGGGQQGGADDGAWGDGGYEQASPAEQYVSAIRAANADGDFQRAMRLANQARDADPEHAWLNQNYGTIQLLAERDKRYREAIQNAISNLERGNVDESIDALKRAMQNASTRLGQDQDVRTLLEDAKRIAQMEREEAIERARREGERSAYERDRERARYQQRREENRRSAQALRGALMGVLGAVSQAKAARSTSTTVNPGAYSDDIIQRKVRENQRKYGDLMKKYEQSHRQNLHTAPKTPRRQPGNNANAGWATKSSQPAAKTKSSGFDKWEGDFSSQCDGKAPGIYEFGECFEHTDF